MNAFVAPGMIAELTGSPSVQANARPPEYLVLVSAVGDVFTGADNSDGLVNQLHKRLQTLAGYEITAVKRDLLRNAKEEGDTFSDLFLSLGPFAILAGAALLINTLVMLAEERRRELGIMRSLGMSRVSLVITFVLEGIMYAISGCCAQPWVICPHGAGYPANRIWADRNRGSAYRSRACAGDQLPASHELGRVWWYTGCVRGAVATAGIAADCRPRCLPPDHSALHGSCLRDGAGRSSANARGDAGVVTGLGLRLPWSLPPRTLVAHRRFPPPQAASRA